MVKDQLQEIFRDLFFDDTIELREDMTSEDVEGWDSLTYIQLISMCESEFQVKFTTAEVLHFQNVGELIASIESKMK